MDFLELIKTRRSIRKFSNEPLEQNLIEKIIEAGTFAPSACNIQGWRFVVVKDQELKDKMFEMGASIVIKSAPTAILILYDSQSTNTQYQDYAISAAACAQNMLLAAENFGLGACMIAHLPQKKDLRKLFKIPSRLEPIICVILGKKIPGQKPFEVPRKFPLEKLIGYNKFNSDLPVPEISAKERLIKIIRKIYYRLPTFLKKIANNFIDKKFVKKFDN